jgi:4-hydroxyacetophenone monooxygenase
MPEDHVSGNQLREIYTHNVRKSVVSEEEFRRHVGAAHTFALLLSAIHVTADPSLFDRYASRVGGPPPMRPGQTELPQDPTARRELIDIMAAALSREDQPAYLGTDDRELFQRMSNIAAGFEVQPTHLEMNLVQAGFEPDSRSITPTKVTPKTVNLAIIGAGMTGIDAAVKASERGFDFEIYDLEAGPGGLWWSQTYPGVAVDTPAVYYSLSWEITPHWIRSCTLGAAKKKKKAPKLDK